MEWGKNVIKKHPERTVIVGIGCGIPARVRPTEWKSDAKKCACKCLRKYLCAYFLEYVRILTVCRVNETCKHWTHSAERVGVRTGMQSMFAAYPER